MTTGTLSEELSQSAVWTDEMVARAGLPVEDVPFISIGGGIGSFVTVDYLRIAGDRARYGLQTRIVHIFRTYVSGSHGPHLWMRRKGSHGFAYQGFNYPKSVWGGQLKAQMRRLDGADRAKLYQLMGGTNTPKRRRWQQQMREGRQGGWYEARQGNVDEVTTDSAGLLVTSINGEKVKSHFVIDCTGLEADLAEHRVLADLLENTGATRNPLGRLEVERHFEIKGTASGNGALYASGATTLGGYFPGVDTFLGLQIAAQEVADDLARRGWCRHIGPVRSTTQWLKWMLGRKV